jgi:hypothetical protein
MVRGWAKMIHNAKQFVVLVIIAHLVLTEQIKSHVQ